MSRAASIRVFAEHRRSKPLCDGVKRIVASVLEKENRKASVNVVFTDDDTIVDLNKRFLKHDYITDVLSFPLGEENDVPEGEIYVNVDQAERQAAGYSVTVRDEALRLVIHGLLHLIGYTDETDEGRSEMRLKEDTYLKLFYTDEGLD